MEDNEVTNRKFTRRGFLGGAVISGTALSLSATLGTALPAYASGASSTGDGSEESLPSGRQFEIRRGDKRAVITEVGAGLRVFEVGGREFLFTYGENEMSMFSEGQVLIPFPNRIDQGSYVFNGVTEQLPLNEPARMNAIHGLTRWMNWRVAAQKNDSITMSLVLHAYEGYPFVLSLQETYTLTDSGLMVQTAVQNIGSSAAP